MPKATCRLTLRIIHGNRRLRAYCGADARADFLPHDGPAVGGSRQPLTDRAPTTAVPSVPTDHRGTDDGRADDAGPTPSAHDGRADRRGPLPGRRSRRRRQCLRPGRRRPRRRQTWLTSA